MALNGDLAGFRAYHAERGQTVSADDTEAMAALVRGADVVRLQYIQRITTLPSPIPDAFAHAEYEAAWIEQQSPGFFSKTSTPGQEKVLTKVGDIQWTVIPAADGTAASSMPVSSKVEAIMSPYVSTVAASGNKVLGGFAV